MAAHNFDPNDETKMRSGRDKATSMVWQYLRNPYTSQAYNTITLFLTYADITDCVSKCAEKQREKQLAIVENLMRQIASGLHADAVSIQRFSELTWID